MQDVERDNWLEKIRGALGIPFQNSTVSCYQYSRDDRIKSINCVGRE